MDFDEQESLEEPESDEMDWWRNHDIDDDEYQNEMESAQDNCGLDENDWCWNSGTEHCSFFCPFREIFQNADSFPFQDVDTD